MADVRVVVDLGGVERKVSPDNDSVYPYERWRSESVWPH